MNGLKIIKKEVVDVMTEVELINLMKENGFKSPTLVQRHLKLSFKGAQKFCDSFELNNEENCSNELIN